MTSVEWLIEQLQAPCRGIPSHIIERAKEMYNQEMVTNSNQLVISDEEALRLVKEMNKQPMRFVPYEISDEEIEKEVEERYPIKKVVSMSMLTSFDLKQLSKQIGFVAGVMWYKEKIKNK
jgi:hypothetical protein